ncbi:MAG: TPM domain-containing protein [Sphingobacteriales bacterium]|nr:MAG: TPM domain-containing protein [Sphingobacteriales bacterium]
MLTAKDFFSKQEQIDIVCAIRDAETQTSGEVRVHIEDNCPQETLDRAASVFETLELHKTAQRNSILFYLSVQDHKFAVIGDAGINLLVPEHFWEEIRDKVLKYFSAKQYSKGLVEGITIAGNKLREFFPYQENDINELPDEISFGD